MLIVAAVLSVLMGVTLGLLGGGGSILTVPLLVYVLGMDPKEAIATSLIVVGVTSIAAMVQHARAGQVRWKTGAVFGGFAMIGAYAGGLAAAYLSGTTLLVLFAFLMAVTGAAMLRKRRQVASTETRGFSLWRVVLEGLAVGGVTGLVGAGGGFLVVPALVLLGGLNMRAAIGTSLLVVAMKSFAGLAGHLSHLSIDYRVAGIVTLAAVVGSLGGAALAKRISPDHLRRGFAYFVLAMAGFILYQQSPGDVMDAIFVERWPFWAGGVAIGLFVVAFFLSTRKALGVSTGYADFCGAATNLEARRSWRIPFLIGIVLGGLVASLLAGGPSPTWSMGMFDTIVSSSFAVKATVFSLGGILIGFGTRLGGGCTSGHGIVGVALLAPSSLITTGAFMASGFVVTNLMIRVIGG